MEQEMELCTTTRSDSGTTMHTHAYNYTIVPVTVSLHTALAWCMTHARHGMKDVHGLYV